MPRLIWTSEALLDVQRVHRFLAPKSVDAARRSIGAIRRGLKVLEQQPSLGRPVEDLADEFREWVIDFGDSGYVVRYRFDSEAVIIVAIRHQKEVGF
jgi:plasmid stabilization system protein ParE